MVIVWTPEWDAKLLVAIWETCGSKFDWETTADIMGGTCTPEAIMQHLRTMTRKAAEKRREQRQILLEAHAARAASVAKGKAKRKWGYSRSALKRIEETGKGYESDASADGKTKTPGKRRTKRSPSVESAQDDDAPAAKNDRHKKSRQTARKIKNDPDLEWHGANKSESTAKLQAEIEARGLKRRRGTFWNNYQDDVEV